MGHKWEGPAPSGLVRPPQGPKAQQRVEGGQTLAQMGPKAHPRAPRAATSLSPLLAAGQIPSRGCRTT